MYIFCLCTKHIDLKLEQLLSTKISSQKCMLNPSITYRHNFKNFDTCKGCQMLPSESAEGP